MSVFRSKANVRFRLRSGLFLGPAGETGVSSSLRAFLGDCRCALSGWGARGLGARLMIHAKPCDLARAVKDRETTVGIFMHAHACGDIMGALGRGRDLQFFCLEIERSFDCRQRALADDTARWRDRLHR